MNTEPDHSVDGQLRDAFAVDDAAANRVASRALRTPATRRTRSRVRGSLALAAVGLSAALVVWVARDRADVPAPVLAPAATINLSGSLVDGVLVMPIAGDAIFISGPGRREDRPADGSGVVFVEGEVQ